MTTLDRSTNRCLAHTDVKGEWCESRETCKRYVAIRFDVVPAPAEHRCCRHGNDRFIPLHEESEPC